MGTAFVLLADTAAPGGGGLAQLGIFAVFGLALYFLLVRPQQKRQKEQQQLLQQLEPGQDVVTVGGLHGQIVAVADAFVDLRVTEAGDDEVVLRYQRQAIASIVGADAPAGAPEDDDA